MRVALTGLLQILDHAAKPVPEPGQRLSVLGSAGQPAAVIELTEVRIVPISEVDDNYARAERSATLNPVAGISERFWYAAPNSGCE